MSNASNHVLDFERRKPIDDLVAPAHTRISVASTDAEQSDTDVSVAAMRRLASQVSRDALSGSLTPQDRVVALSALAQASLAIRQMTSAPGESNRPKTVSGVVPLSESNASAVQRLPVNWPKTTVIIPTLNEAKNIRLLLPRMPVWLHEIIVVDGRSTDGTVDVVREVMPSAKIALETKAGKGAALRRGFAEATGEVIVIIDADGSMDPNEIYSFVGALVAGADFVKGSRFSSGAGTDDMSFIRQLGNWGLGQAVMLLFGGRFSDLCYGYMAFWKRHLPDLSSSSNGFEIETMLVIRALQAKMRIVEVASFEHCRIHGESNLRAVPDGLRILRVILSERLGISRDRPKHV